MAKAESFEGRTLGGRYRIEALVGAGGFSVVYRAVHVTLGRPVAVKVLREQGDARSEVQRARFEREAKTLAALSHPNVVGVIDFGVEDDVPYLVLELVEGESLRALVDRGPLEPDRALRIARQILRGLGYAHAKGVMHRDLKPTNVELAAMPGEEDHVKILDFGLAKLFGTAGENEPKLTAVGTSFGTPEYVAPEQASGQPTDGRADLYALGVILFEMIAGRRPFEGGPVEVMRAKLLQTPPRLRELRPDLQVPQSIDAAIAHAMERDPAHRFASAEEMLAALEDPTTEIVVAEEVVPRPAPARPPVRVQEPTTEIVLAEEVETLPTSDAPLPRAPVAMPAPRVPRPVLVAPAAPLPPVPDIPLPTLVSAPAVMPLEPEPPPPAPAQPAVSPRAPEPDSPGSAPTMLAREPDASPSAVTARAREPDASPSTVTARAREPDAPAPTAAAPAISAARRPGDLVVLVGVLLLLTLVVALASGGEEEEVASPRRAAPARNVARVVAKAAAPGDPRDPWAEPVPAEIADLATRIRGGERLDRGALLPLGSYSRDNPTDARPHLLLAYAYGDMQWSRDAVRRYVSAFRADRSSRGDPRMLRDLVRLSTSRAVGDEAASAIRTIYGDEALPAVEQAIETAGPSDAARLERLAKRLRTP